MAQLGRLAWTLPAAGLLLGVPWIRPYFADPADLQRPLRFDHDTWARISTSSGYALFTFTQVLGLVSLVLGLFALYGYLATGRAPRGAMAALILGVTGTVYPMMILGIAWLAVPILAAMYQSGVDVCMTSHIAPTYLMNWGDLPEAFCYGWQGPAGPFWMAALMNLVEPACALSQGIAIWRSGLLPRWVAPAFAAGYYLCHWIEPTTSLVAGLLLVVAGGRIALQIGRERSAARAAHNAPTTTRL
jgi:hypothetical protein